MRGPQGAAEPARYALLGLLVGGPRHGYDLIREFASGSALSHILHLSPSHLYALLGRLERDQLITGHREEIGNHPPRRVYELTEAGRTAVEHWVDEPVRQPRDMRIDFPLKLYLASQFDPARAAQLVERQHRLFSSYVHRIESEPLPAGPDAGFIHLLREARLGRVEAALHWLEACEQVIPKAAGAP